MRRQAVPVWKHHDLTHASWISRVCLSEAHGSPQGHVPVPTGARVRWTPRLFAALAWVRLQPGDVVRADTGAEALAAEPLQPVGERLEIGLELRVERRPVPGMLFRPEEIHPRSAPGAIFRRATHLTVGIADEVSGFDPEHLLVSHLNDDGGPTV